MDKDHHHVLSGFVIWGGSSRNLAAWTSILVKEGRGGLSCAVRGEGS